MSSTVRAAPDLRVIAGTTVEQSPTEQAPQDTGGGGSGGSADPPLPAWQRKRANKLINEQLKLFGSAMNTLAGAVLGASIVVPLIQNPKAFIENYNPLWFLGGVALHLVGQLVLGLNYRSEE